MLGLYKKNHFKIATYATGGRDITSLLLYKTPTTYEDVINKNIVDAEDVYNASYKKLVDVIKISGNYISKKTAIEYYKSIEKEKEEHISLL